MSEFFSHQATSLIARPAPVMNIFAEYVDPDQEAYVVPPCRSIEITDQVRALDARQQAARAVSPAAAWPAKALLSEANLRLAKRAPVKPGRVLEARRFAVKAAKLKRYCACGEALRAGKDLCRQCNRRPGRLRPCMAGCGGRAYPESPLGICRGCWSAAERLAQRLTRLQTPVMCSTGCGQLLGAGKRRRLDGRCGKCGLKIQSGPRKLSPRASCKAGCGAVVKAGTKTGMCRFCCAKWKAEKYHSLATERTPCKAGCGARLPAGANRRLDLLCGLCGRIVDRRVCVAAANKSLSV